MSKPTHEQYLTGFRVKTACFSFILCLLMVPFLVVIPGIFPNVMIPKEIWGLEISVTSGLFGYIVGSANSGLPNN